uniref:Uncharacterized protein n=1 Tax=Octopus bimaculoides TaxID=37653 RepID=A0A0L8FMH0_OCTBM
MHCNTMMTTQLKTVFHAKSYDSFVDLQVIREIITLIILIMLPFLKHCFIGSCPFSTFLCGIFKPPKNPSGHTAMMLPHNL